MVTILSIDGGGIRGIIPAAFLAEMEKRAGRPICELFDLVAGTSTGGILATVLTLPDSHGRPMYSAAQVHSLYLEQGGEIFPRSLTRSAATLGGLTRSIYSPKPLEQILQQYLGHARLHETLTEILVTAYDMTSSTPWFFKTSFAREHRTPVDDPLLTQVVRATTAAPTYFPPLMLENHCLIDGGVFASNPSLCAYAQARNMFPGEDEFLVISLGTGLQVHKRLGTGISRWGILDWAVPISTVMLNSSSATVDYQMRALLGNRRYARFQVQLPDGAAEMDDADDKSRRELEALAQQAISAESAEIDRLCQVLTERKGRAPAAELVGLPLRNGAWRRTYN